MLHSLISEQNVSLCFSFQTIWWSSINGVMDRDQVVSCCSSLNNGISQRFNKTSHEPPHKLSLQNSPAYEHKHIHENKCFLFLLTFILFWTHMTFYPPCNIKDDIFKHAEECCLFPCNCKEGMEDFQLHKGCKSIIKVDCTILGAIFQVFWSNTIALCKKKKKTILGIFMRVH